jgi:hypothetical protein
MGAPPPAAPPPQGPPGTADSPYARMPYGYSAQSQPQQYPRTISGLPVGYQLELDKRDSEVRRLGETLKILMYEREQSDTNECIAEIRRLADVGYQVGEYELNELKAKPREQRGAYLQHIVAKYQKVGTEFLPPLLGDPTAAMAPQQPGGPASEDEMQRALKITEQNPRMPFEAALNYARNQGQQQQGGMPPLGPNGFGPGVEGPGGPMTVYGPHGPQQVAFADPYHLEPSANGRVGY